MSRSSCDLPDQSRRPASYAGANRSRDNRGIWIALRALRRLETSLGDYHDLFVLRQLVLGPVQPTSVDDRCESHALLESFHDDEAVRAGRRARRRGRDLDRPHRATAAAEPARSDRQGKRHGQAGRAFVRHSRRQRGPRAEHRDRRRVERHARRRHGHGSAQRRGRDARGGQTQQEHEDLPGDHALSRGARGRHLRVPGRHDVRHFAAAAEGPGRARP